MDISVDERDIEPQFKIQYRDQKAKFSPRAQRKVL